MKSSISYYDYFLGFLIIFSIFSIGLLIYNTEQSTEQSSEQIEKPTNNYFYREAVQEIDNLKMTVSTFESVISTLETDNQKLSKTIKLHTLTITNLTDKISLTKADNQKLSEIIEKHSKRISGWGLIFLLLFNSVLSGGVVIFIQTVRDYTKLT